MGAESKPSIKRRLREYLERERPAAFSGEVWETLLAHLAPVSESYLRDLLRATGLPFEQPYAGIVSHTFEELEASLRQMLDVYLAAMAAGDRSRARYARRQVIGAKDRAKFQARNFRLPEPARASKQEMVEWMMIWLENPAVFPAWVEARKRATAPPPACAADSPESS